MTNFLLTAVQDGTLTLLMLNGTDHKALPGQSASGPTQSFDEDTAPLLTADIPSDETAPRRFSTVFNELHVTLLAAFHAHWQHLTRSEVEMTQRPTVMQFEQVFGAWRVELVRWLCRGRIAGWFDDRGLLELDRNADGHPKS